MSHTVAILLTLATITPAAYSAPTVQEPPPSAFLPLPPRPKSTEEQAKSKQKSKAAPAAPAATPAAPAPTATANDASAELKLKVKADCELTMQGNLARKSTRQVKGKAPITISGQQEFEIKVPGELQELEAPNGKVQYRFIPRPNGLGATGRFKALETSVALMKETHFTVEGTYVSGMSTWYISADARGGELKPSPADVTMRGKVLESTAENLPVGTDKVPVVVGTVRLMHAKEGGASAPPVLRFQGLSLWALANAKAPFTAVAEAVHDGKGARDEVSGTTRVTFAVKPIVTPK